MTATWQSKVANRMLVRTLTGVGIGFVMYLIWRQRDELSQWLRTIDYGWATLSLLVLFAANACAGLLFAELTYRNPENKALRRHVVGAFLFAQLGKYVPGRIWGVAQQAALLTGKVPARIVVAANFKVFIVTLVLTTGVGLALLVFLNRGFGVAMLTILVTFAASMVLLSANIMNRLLALSRYFLPRRQLPDSAIPDIADSRSKSVAGLSCLLFMLFFSLGWFLLFSEALDLGATQGLKLAAVLALSSVIGMLSMLPGGLGAREAAMLGFGAWLAADLTMLASLALVSRAAIIVIDLISVPVGSAMLRLSEPDGWPHE